MNDILTFYENGVHLPYSNFYIGKAFWVPDPFTLTPCFFVTGEHAFQSWKATNVEDFHHVRNADRPGEAKRRGWQIALRTDWDEMKCLVMHMVVRAKFSQDPSLRDLLLSTGDAHLEEGNNWGDSYWGTVKNTGLNRLGKILMLVRAELRS